MMESIIKNKMILKQKAGTVTTDAEGFINTGLFVVNVTALSAYVENYDATPFRSSTGYWFIAVKSLYTGEKLANTQVTYFLDYVDNAFVLVVV